jgi:hypothetical protein
MHSEATSTLHRPSQLELIFAASFIGNYGRLTMAGSLENFAVTIES